MITATEQTRMLTPPQVAKRLGVCPESVISWIRSGQLTAIDVSSRPGVGRPRFRISEADLQAFLASRAVAPPGQRRRRARIKEYV